MPSQDKLDQAYMDIAARWSQMSHAMRKQVGCIIVKDSQIISDGYNGTPNGFDNNCEFYSKFGSETKPEVLHAESNALTKLAKSTQSSDNATVYITLMPCYDCAKLMIQSGICRVVYGNDYRDRSGVELLEQANIECSSILS
jgi:dCMP deaminase